VLSGSANALDAVRLVFAGRLAQPVAHDSSSAIASHRQARCHCIEGMQRTDAMKECMSPATVAAALAQRVRGKVSNSHQWLTASAYS
jgi:hypothetical protein